MSLKYTHTFHVSDNSFIFMSHTAVECPVLPTDASLDSTANTYQSTVVMSCTDMVNERIIGIPVGQALTLTCQANKTWDYWDDADTTACIRE